MNAKNALGALTASILLGLILNMTAAAGPVLLTYNGPGTATVLLPLASGGSFDVYGFPYYVDRQPAMCDDAQTDVNPGLTWWANPHTLTGDISQMKFYSEFSSPAAALLAYEEAAVIFYESVTTGVVADGTPQGTNGAEGNVAVWYLFSNSSLYQGQYAIASDSEIQAVINSAAGIVDSGTFDYSKVTFWTPDPSPTLNPARPSLGLGAGIGASQEFIMLSSYASNIVPEPGTYAMFGVGLMTLGWLGRRLRRK